MTDGSVEEHLRRVLSLVAPLAPVELPLTEAAGLVAAEDVTADVAVPRFDHAAMDGYAVRATDVGEAHPEAPVTLPVAGVAAAGDARVGALAAGTALRIMTGAAVPAGADAVVPFEWTDRGDPVRVARPVTSGRHIRRAGEDVAEGATVLLGGAPLGARHLGLLAAVGRRAVAVRPAPRVAVLATGDELARHTLGPAQVIDSNSTTLAAAATALGAAVTTSGPVPDDPRVLGERLAEVVGTSDLVVTTGGISAGDHDVVKAALRGRDDFWFGPVRLRPGRPQGCGLVTTGDGRRVPVVCLPGTPVAAYGAFLLFVAPALASLSGRAATAVTGELAHEVRLDRTRTVLLPARRDDAGRLTVLPGHAGHSLRLLAAADVLLVVPPGERPLAAGAAVAVLSL